MLKPIHWVKSSAQWYVFQRMNSWCQLWQVGKVWWEWYVFQRMKIVQNCLLNEWIPILFDPKEPCPFGLGLRKFALDPTLVNFFKNVKKFTSVGWSDTCNFFLKMKKFDLKKNYNYGIKAPLKSHSCIFFWNQFFFHFQKKLQVLADPIVVFFFEIHLIQHL